MTTVAALGFAGFLALCLFMAYAKERNARRHEARARADLGRRLVLHEIHEYQVPKPDFEEEFLGRGDA